MSMDAYLDAYLKEQIEQMSQTLKDGVLKSPEETGVYVEDGDRVQLTPQGEASVSCRFTVSGDTLTLEMQQKDMALTLNLTKQYCEFPLQPSVEREFFRLWTLSNRRFMEITRNQPIFN